MFNLGYSTFATKNYDPFEMITMVRSIGYTHLEICLSDGWPTSPDNFSLTEQKKLSNICNSLGFANPGFFGNIDVCNLDDKDEMKKTLLKFNMARTISSSSKEIIISTTIGHNAPRWDSGKNLIADALVKLSDIAKDNNVIIALEAHAGTDFETPEKAVWIMEQTNHSNIRLDLDISHFYVEGSDVDHSVDLCAPYAAMVHIKDGEKVDGEVKYCLTGDGTINIETFLLALSRNNITHLPVFAEVSVQQSSKRDYDPRFTAEFCYNSLMKAINKL